MFQRRNKNSSVTFSSAEVFLSSQNNSSSREYLSSISAADVYWNSIDGKPRNISPGTISDFRHLFPSAIHQSPRESRKQSLHFSCRHGFKMPLPIFRGRDFAFPSFSRFPLTFWTVFLKLLFFF
ncbi:hypothetical protein CEXT_286801 [Caerostris extrusa]|uniref:Uncharacterized protein n=1 Tax=Caerostris extrusa TaxID=172846 RepID=A0AAV4TDV4_CAEEX|nr:hypothetical protein CEXT_286801 [Caerostris extrusa]